MAIVLESSSTFTETESYAYTHTAGNLLVVVYSGLTNGGTGQVRRLTYNGLTLTKVHQSTRDKCWSEIWYLIDPPTGSNTLSVVGSNAHDTSVAYSLSGVDIRDDGPVVQAIIGNHNGGSNISQSISTTGGGFVICTINSDNGGNAAFTPGTDVTEHSEVHHAGHDSNCWTGYMAAGVVSEGTETFGVTWGAGSPGDSAWCMVSIAAGDGDLSDKADFTLARGRAINQDTTSVTVDMTDAEVMVVLAHSRGAGENMTACTFDGVSLTKQEDANGSGGNAFLWTLVGPTQGSATLAMTKSANVFHWQEYGIKNVKAGDEILGTAQSIDDFLNITEAQRGLVLYGVGANSDYVSEPPHNWGNRDNEIHHSGHGGTLWTGYTRSWTDASIKVGADGGGTSRMVAVAFNPAEIGGAGTRRNAFIFSLAGVVIPAATIAGLYQEGAVAL